MSSASSRRARLFGRRGSPLVITVIASSVLGSPLAEAQTPQPLPPLSITAQKPKPARVRASRTATAPAPQSVAVTPQGQTTGALTSPTAQQALRDIQRTPGGVALLPADTFRNNSVASTLKDVLDYVPGVFVQPKWGDDVRLSIRGSSLSRNFHLRGIQLYMDGMPINYADGYSGFEEIDPTAYKYVEVFKGANGLRFGANSLGGAINFVTPTGRDPYPNGVGVDVGTFGYRRFQANAGGANGPWDGFITASNQQAQGFRDHSNGYSTKAAGNIGYQISPDVETRFYLSAADVNQRIPGSVTRQSALTQPRTAFAENIVNDWQRNVDAVRVANKTTIRLDATTFEFGAYAADRHLMHPIFQWLDYRYKDYGGFGRLIDDRIIGGYRNRLIAGVNVQNGTIDADQFVNTGGFKGAQLSALLQKAENTTAYVENSFYALPSVAVIAGTQFLHTLRDQTVNFSLNGDVSGRRTVDRWNPKGGLLWDIDPGWQAFANVSRSTEVASFGEGVSPNFFNPNFPTINFFQIKPQVATTYEIGTRGRRPDVTWDLALYRANIRDELQCQYSAFGNCNVTNLDRTIHQGIEAGFGAAIFKGVFTNDTKGDAIWARLAYTLNDFRFDNDPVFGNNVLPGAPRHFVRGELLYKHASGFYAGPNLEWVPNAYFVDSANSLTTAGYAIWGLKAGIDDGPRSFYVEARNLANTAYIASASIIDRANPALPLFEPGTGRAVYAGMRLKW